MLAKGRTSLSRVNRPSKRRNKTSTIVKSELPNLGNLKFTHSKNELVGMSGNVSMLMIKTIISLQCMSNKVGLSSKSG